MALKSKKLKAKTDDSERFFVNARSLNEIVGDLRWAAKHIKVIADKLESSGDDEEQCRGHNIGEIAHRLGCYAKTVKRVQ